MLHSARCGRHHFYRPPDEARQSDGLIAIRIATLRSQPLEHADFKFQIGAVDAFGCCRQHFKDGEQLVHTGLVGVGSICSSPTN